jgi:tetratricopeptide (TPR) repeat protein
VAGLADSAAASPLLRLIAKTAIGLHQWLTASLDASLRTTADALELARTTGVHVWDFHISLHSAAAHLSNGDVEAASSVLNTIARGLQKARPFDLLYYDFLVAWRALLRGDLPQASAAQKRSLDATVATGIPLTEAQLRLLGVWIEFRRTPAPSVDVLCELETIHRMARQTRSRLVEFSAYLAEAHFHFLSSRNREGARCLANAMRLGRENGYRNIYAWQRPMIAELCVRAVAADIESEYVQTLVRERGLASERVPVEVDAWPWPVKVVTLGRFEVLREGHPIHFTGKAQKKPLALLKALIALGGENVGESRLADLLWPDADGDAAQQALSTTLHRLRQLLGHEAAIRPQAGRLSLDRRTCWVDLWALDHLLTQAERAIAGSRPGIQAWTQSAQWTERAMDIHPCSEECCRALMQAYQRLGRRDEALAVYHRCSRHLEGHLGTRPSPQTLVLLEVLKST